THDTNPPLQPPEEGPPFFDPSTNVNYTIDSFWNDSDHGATRADIHGRPLHFAALAVLDNTVAGTETPNTPAARAYPQPGHRHWPLGDPRNRFGHDNVVPLPPGGELLGRPKEYMDPTNILSFIGAYTHEETSSPNFGFPGLPIYNGGTTSPMRWGSLPASSATDVNGDGRDRKSVV